MAAARTWDRVTTSSCTGECFNYLVLLIPSLLKLVAADSCRGEMAFCSLECRYREMLLFHEEEEEEEESS